MNIDSNTRIFSALPPCSCLAIYNICPFINPLQLVLDSSEETRKIRQKIKNKIKTKKKCENIYNK